MTTTATIEPNPEVLEQKISRSATGYNGGIITRLMSTCDLGEILQLFVFIDLLDTCDQVIRDGNTHPHSGIATVSDVFESSTRYKWLGGAAGARSYRLIPSPIGARCGSRGRGACTSWSGPLVKKELDVDH